MIKGFYRVVASSNSIKGWVADTDRAASEVTVRLCRDDVEVAHLYAVEERPDVFKAGCGPLKSGFTFKLPSVEQAPHSSIKVLGYDHAGNASELTRLDDLIEIGSALNRSPVFIVGSPRSGTSALVDALLSLGYNGFREGNYLSLIFKLEKLVKAHFESFYSDNPKVLTHHIDQNILLDRLIQIVVEPVNQLNKSTAWFDKTGNPEMIYALPTVANIWPDAVFIFAKRRAIENVVSRIKKFPDQSFEYHCRDWAANMLAWRTVRDALPSSRTLEVEQQAMISAPDAAAKSILNFLGIMPAYELQLISAISGGRPQETEKGSAARILALADLNWSEQQKNFMIETCGHEMQQFGYSFDQSYYLR